MESLLLWGRWDFYVHSIIVYSPSPTEGVFISELVSVRILREYSVISIGSMDHSNVSWLCITKVKDLRRELQDGTVLVELIEIVANEKIPGAHTKPSNSLEMKENIERVIQFMRSRKRFTS